MATDFISRDEAIDNLCESCFIRSCSHDCDAVKAIRGTKPADVRPVLRAEWERPKGFTPRSWIFVCSKCGDRAYFPVPKYFPKGCGYSFCPNCGADMREAGTDG